MSNWIKSDMWSRIGTMLKIWSMVNECRWIDVALHEFIHEWSWEMACVFGTRMTIHIVHMIQIRQLFRITGIAYEISQNKKCYEAYRVIPLWKGLCECFPNMPKFRCSDVWWRHNTVKGSRSFDKNGLLLASYCI